MFVYTHAYTCVHQYHSVNLCRLICAFGTGNRWYRPAYCTCVVAVLLAYYSHTVGMLFNYHNGESFNCYLHVNMLSKPHIYSLFIIIIYVAIIFFSPQSFSLSGIDIRICDCV